MTLSPAEKSRLAALLPKLRDAYDSMLMGQQPVEIRDQNGEIIRFGQPSEAQRAALLRRIITVEHQLGLPSNFGGARKVAFS